MESPKIHTKLYVFIKCAFYLILLLTYCTKNNYVINKYIISPTCIIILFKILKTYQIDMILMDEVTNYSALILIIILIILYGLNGFTWNKKYFVTDIGNKPISVAKSSSKTCIGQIRVKYLQRKTIA